MLNFRYNYNTPVAVHEVRLLLSRAGYPHIISLIFQFLHTCSNWSLVTERLEAKSSQVKGRHGLLGQEHAHLA